MSQTFFGKTHFVSLGERCLPQGAPTSPAISNALCVSLRGYAAFVCMTDPVLGHAMLKELDKIADSARKLPF